MMGCDSEGDNEHYRGSDRIDEARRIRKRLAKHPARLSMFSIEDAILLLHLFKEGGRVEKPTEEQLKRLQAIEKEFFAT